MLETASSIHSAKGGVRASHARVDEDMVKMIVGLEIRCG